MHDIFDYIYNLLIQALLSSSSQHYAPGMLGWVKDSVTGMIPFRGRSTTPQGGSGADRHDQTAESTTEDTVSLAKKVIFLEVWKVILQRYQQIRLVINYQMELGDIDL